MAWFQDFVNETVKDWLDAKRIGSKYASFGMRLTEDFKRLKLTSSQKGKFGADFIAGLLQQKGYVVAQSPGSWSPADVWGIKDHDGRLIIMLVQVKTAFEGDVPERLSPEDREEAALFAFYVAQAFDESALVPPAEKQKPKIVSIGYAGVVVQVAEDQLTPTKERSFYIDGAYPDSLGDQRPLAEKAVAVMYKIL